uniref:HEAT repeat-containing protein 1 isoform X2 n=1 Tax=Ciona intestinalis TaxID=7719 RepID=UPI00089DCF9D|nr:HEAT repeat-containing protein 1 isoform X2 [Ciona intestinalis]|eukprot:XP_018667544.1 HEAT repeat-containing protein 1 isoform X2 [Ciona intestinalis]
MTSLSEQLRRLALPESQVADTFDKRIPSLLFEPGVAATLDRDTFFGLGVNGLEELCLLDPKFRDLFQQDLFSAQAKDTERTTQTKQFNKHLNEKIQSFLIRVCPYFLLKPATKCIEWLIYRFHIHTFNTDDLLMCALPYHGTNLFVRTVQLLDVSHPTNKWCWLSQVKNEGVSLSNKNIATHCTRDLAFLQFICNMLTNAYKVVQENPDWSMVVVLNFYTTTVMGVLQSPKISETLLSKLMPSVLEGLKSSVMEHQASSVMILSQLSVKITFERKVLSNIIKSGLKNVSTKLEKVFLRAILLFSQNQEQFQNLPKKVILQLSSHGGFIQEIVEIYRSGRIEKIVQILVEVLVSNITDSDTEEKIWKTNIEVLTRFVQDLDLTVNLQLLLMRLLVENFTSTQSDKKSQKFLLFGKLLGQLQRKFPLSFDKVISEFFSREDVDKTTSGLLLSIFGASAKHQLIHDSSVSVAIGLLHPEDSVRSQALRHLSDSLFKDPTSEVVRFSQDNVIRILGLDDSPLVVEAALQLLRKHVDLFKDDHIEVSNTLVNLFFSKISIPDWKKAVQVAAQVLTVLSSAVPDENNVVSMRTTAAVLHILLMSLTEKGWSTLAGNILKSDFCQKNSFFEAIRVAVLNKGKASQDNKVSAKFFHDLLCVVEQISDCENTQSSSAVFYFLCTIGVDDLELLTIICNSLSQKSANLKHKSSSDLSLNDGFYDLLQQPETPDRDIISLHFDTLRKFLESVVSLKSDISIPSFPQLGTLLQNAKRLDLTTPSKISLLTKTFLSLLNLSESAKTGYENDEKLKSRITASVNSLISLFLNEVLRSQSLLDFLPIFLCEEFINPCLSSPVTCLQTLNILKVFLHATMNKVPAKATIDASHPILPCLLLLCSSNHHNIRRINMESIQCVSSMKTNPVSSLMVHLTKHAEELTSDPEYILQCFANYFNEKNKPAIKKSRHGLLKTLVQNMVNESAVSKLGVAFMTRCINKVDPFHFDPLLPLVTTFVDQSNVRTLDENEALLTTEWLQKLTPDSLNETLKRELFFKVLTFQTEDKSSYLPQNVVFNLITKPFYTSLSDEIKQQLISTLLDIGQSTANPDVAKMVFKVFKVIPLRSNYIIKELKKSFPSIDTKSTAPSGVIAAKRARLSKSTSSESGVSETETPTWKRMIVLLEVLQHKKKIIKPKLLVAHLFTALNWMIDLQTGNDVIDYGTQLVLGALHNVFMIAKSKLGAKDDTDIRNSLRVELLVKCIQTSGNTQTCQHAVVLLAEAASICPEKLLHSVMSIFTFMGSNLLRRDDSYSFQIITKTIHTVVPALLQHMESATSGISKNTVTDIIRVFVDALPHIPPHRRLVVFEELINTLGGNEYLWQTLLLLVASRANKITKTSQEDEQDILSGSEEDVFLPSTVDALMEVCSSVSNLFPDHLQLESMVRMLNFISLVPDENDPKQKIDLNLPNLIDVPKQSTSHLRRLHLAVVSFASHLLSLEGGISNSFKLEKSMEHDAAENATKMLTKFQSLLETALSYLSQTTTAVSNTHDDMTSRYYRTLQNRLNSLLDKINNLLPSDTFMLVVSSILHEQSSNTTVHKVIELFNDRVAHTKHTLTPDQENVLLHISRQLIVLCGDHGTDNHGMRAVAYTGLRHVARMCGIGCATHLIPILSMICDITKEKQPPIQVISSAMLCLGELFSTLKAHCISHLPSIAPCHCDASSPIKIREKLPHDGMYIISLSEVSRHLTTFHQSLPGWVYFRVDLCFTCCS